jgi:hypothetical protein
MVFTDEYFHSLVYQEEIAEVGLIDVQGVAQTGIGM